MKPDGAILYEGPSRLDGAPIVAIATGLARTSRNVKTGAMIQIWILRADVSPVDATHSGADASICGGCPHRGRIEDGRNVGRSCYVRTYTAPRAVYAAYQRGAYPRAGDLAELGAGRRLRLGAYGDPAAVPAHIWESLCSRADGWTGYTHQWRAAPGLQPYCMASVDTPEERVEAQLAGWRTFRVRSGDASRMTGEIDCPASAEAGHKTTCAACGLCRGSSSKSRKSIVIRVHGPGTRAFEARASA